MLLTNNIIINNYNTHYNIYIPTFIVIDKYTYNVLYVNDINHSVYRNNNKM